jgi:hypothetical protein
MTVRQLLENADSRELAEWQAYFTLERRQQEEQARKAEAGRTGKVQVKAEPRMLSEALKAQLATKKVR